MSEVDPNESAVSNVSTKIPKSRVWNHFKVSETTPMKAICKNCPRHKNEYAYSNGGTKNLMNHLQSQHQAQLDLFEPVYKQKLPRIDEAMMQQPVYSKQLFEELIVKWIVKRNHSFLEVESVEFNEIISLLKLFRRYDVTMFSADTLKRKVMESYENMRVVMIGASGSWDSKVSFTSDCWTSPNNIALMGVTAHFIDVNWNMMKKILYFHPIHWDSQRGKSS